MSSFINALKKPKTWLAIVGVLLIGTLAVSLTLYGYNQWINPAIDKVVNPETTESVNTALQVLSI